MELKLDLKIFLFLIIFCFTKQLEIYILCLLFALLHELGHIAVGRILGYKLKSFKIMAFGFSIFFKTNINEYNKKIKKGNIYVIKRLLIAMAGPITNIMIIIITYILPINSIFKEYIIYINLIIALFNLIPIYPLDGSVIIKNILKLFFTNEKSYKYTNIISNITIAIFTAFCSIFILYAENIAILLILIYLWILVINENKRQRIRDRIYSIDIY